MTIEQAIKELNEQKAALDKHIARGGEFCEAYAEALGTAIDLMEREIPRAVVGYNPKATRIYGSYDEDDIGGYCPRCGAPLYVEEECYICRQRISWELTECIYNGCDTCGKRLVSGGKVCEHYADKVDEICRIHGEAENG